MLGVLIVAVGFGSTSWASLVRMSGVTLPEQSLTSSKPGYRAYITRTPAFFPW